VPEEGTAIWCDYLAVLESSKRKALATKFIDFLNRPEVAARNAWFVNYATPNMAARAHLPAEYLEDRVINPDAAVVLRSEFYRPLPPRAQRTTNSVFIAIVK
jgi:spermidine/putrescine transport system substrate-binding protein